MKKILFLMGRYLPKPSANSICVDNIIDEMLERNIEVACVCYQDFQKGRKDKVRIIKTKRNCFNSILYKCENTPGIFSSVKSRIAKLFLDIRDVFFLHCWPYNEPLYWRKTYKKCEELREYFDYDTVVCVHMPLSSLLIGHKLKQVHPEINYIPYFLDSLSDGNRLRYFSEQWNFRKKFKWEKKLLSNADMIIAMNSSKSHHERVSKDEIYYSRMRYLDIPLLKQGITVSSDPFSHDRINVIFSGTMNYPLRNVPYLLEILKYLENENVDFYFVGNCNFDSLKRSKQRNIKYIPCVPHDELLSYLQFADVYLNLGVLSPSAISGKIFEYMSYGKPIISTYSVENEACIPYLKRYQLALLINENENAKVSANKLINFLIATKGQKVDFEYVKKEFKDNTPEEFINTLINGGI